MTLFARLLVVAAALPLALATGWGNTPSKASSCKSNEFYWGGKDCCLPHGGASNPPSPPKGSSCPSSWEWNNGKNCCVPKTPPPASPPSCSSGWGWDSGKNCCTPHTSTSVKTTQAPPPKTTYTAPAHTTKSSPPPATSSTSCGTNQWYWSPKSCCLPHGGSPQPPKPPAGSDCPSNWEWHSGKKCCVPHHPDQPPPQCSNGWGWNSGSLCCVPHNPTTTTKPPTPSNTPPSTGHGYGNTGNGGYGWGNTGNSSPHKGWKRSAHKARGTSMCPSGMEACLTSTTGLTDNFECVDTSSDLHSCGGCASMGAGQDCTTISGSQNVGCRAGECVVLTCASGFLKSIDNKTCVKI